MKSNFTQTKINAILLTLFGSFSAYSMASGVCSNPSGCRIGSGSNLHGTVLISGQNYKNSVPNVNDFLSGDHYSVVFDTDAYGETEPIQLIFDKNANIVLDSSFLNDPAYGDKRDHFHLTGVNIESDSSSAIIPKGVQFTLKGYPKQFNNIGMTAVDVTAGYVDSQADMNIDSANSVAYEVYSSTGKIDAHDSTINLGADAYTSFAGRSEEDGQLNFKRIKIKGSGQWNMGVSVFDKGNVNFIDSSMNFSNPESLAFNLSNGSNVNIENSSIEAGYGISLHTRQYTPKENNFNIKNSSFMAKDALLGINDRRLYSEADEDDEKLGDESIAAQQPFTLTADHSKLAGRIFIDLRPSPKITFNLKNGSSWLITGNSEMDELNIHDSTVSFRHDGHSRGVSSRSSNNFKILTIHGDLNGSNGVFNMNTNLADGQSDKIIIEGQLHGQHQISVADSRKRPKTANGQVTLVEVRGGGDGAFSMMQNYVDAGRYRYFFQQDGNQWILNNVNGALATGGGQHGSYYEISDYANSLIGMRQAANQFVYQLQQPLNTRFNNLKDHARTNNLWLDSNYANNHFDSTQTSYDLMTSGFKQKSYSLQLGYDHILPIGNENNQLYLGAFVGRGHSSVDFNGDYKDGNIKVWTTGIYAGWQNINGWFGDGSYRYSHFKTSANKMDDTSWNAHSLDVLFGRDIRLADQWVVTPKLGLTVGRLSGDQYTESTHFYRSQLGGSIKTSVNVKQVSFTPYVGAYWLHDKNSLGNVIVDDEYLSIKGAGSSGLFEAGVGVDFDRNNHADFKLNYANGQKTEQKFGASLNYRYSW
ncbi:autotransporter outer membrane beta-barrel domain-containing protein [Snodgrassella sp. B3882]|uniref:autotransporter outer membrane beta-barrel domain-containing protein n=1 Tax=Snodgrassella sp. B3882 TaxID=2818037 RepID=UPI00226A602B|nr:autotransporter outer membrane beta-barrel domain-containing protein [Snodgrassella sp. B3882]MCX8745639.1 autotransporter outer membrane beta-barrel domain-containing protein [Snodgrassella sp. B3882]